MLAVFMTCLSTVQAQEGLRLGVKGSFFSTWLFNKNVSDRNASLDYASSFSGTVGAQVIWMFSDTYGLSGEVIYAGQNQKYDGYSGNENNTFTNELKLGYLDIPILFRVSSPKGPYFEIGPQFSLLMGAKETLKYDKSSSSDDNYTDKDVKDDFAGFGVAGVLGFGVDIKLTDNLNLTTGLRFGYMFTDATTEYTEEEALEKFADDKLSFVASASHINTDDEFDYQKSNRAFGGLQLGLQFKF